MKNNQSLVKGIAIIIIIAVIGTTFSFDLEEKDGNTILRFTHGDWKEETDFFASCNYHWGYYMRSLAYYCEKGKGTPFGTE